MFAALCKFPLIEPQRLVGAINRPVMNPFWPDDRPTPRDTETDLRVPVVW